MNLKNLLIALTAFAAINSANANSISIVDTDFSLFDGSTKLDSGLFDVRWGTFSGGVFTPLLGAASNTDNSGYVDLSGPEFSASLSQGDNVTVAANLQLALVITLTDFGTTYAPAVKELVLTDSSWLAPTFALVGQADRPVSFTSNTTVLKGGLYAFNGGNEVLTIGAAPIPEPSSYAAIAGLAILGVVASRRRRSA